MIRLSRFFCGMLLCTAAAHLIAQDLPKHPEVTRGQTRGKTALAGKEMRWFPARPDQADVLAAGFIGGPGHEWLVDGGFQADGSLVMAGNVIGGVFELSVPVAVLGRDGQRPPPYQPTQATDKTTKEPKVTQLGDKIYEPPSWNDAHVTGFIVRLSPDLKRITHAVRLPWGGGAITSAKLAEDGTLYIAGKGSEGTAGLASDHVSATVTVDRFDADNAPSDHSFIAKISANLDAVEWVRSTKGPARAPKITILRNGHISVALADLRTYDPKGKLLNALMVSGGLGSRNSVSPVDGSIAYGHERHWRTGREPWRCPILNIKNPDGSLRYELMQWPGPMVGLDNSRLVSDTAVRGVAHDRDGNILLRLWSDGGNSVAQIQPTDFRRHVGMRGVGLTTAGAHATSFAYLMRLDPEHYQVTGWTLWATLHAGSANGARIENMGESPDGSMLIAGRSAWGLLQTPNRLAKGEPADDFIAVLTPDLGGVRFSSSVPGCGLTNVNDDAQWGLSSGTVRGKSRALFFSGAAERGSAYELVTDTPLINSAQKEFGGGISDGYFVVLDLSKPTAEAQSVDENEEGSRMTYQRSASQVRTKSSRNPPLTVPDGSKFNFSPEFPRHASADAEFRHINHVQWWPTFFYGKPASGTVIWANNGITGSFSVTLDNLVNARGQQDRRILGEVTGPLENATMTLTVHQISPPRHETFDRPRGREGRMSPHEVHVSDSRATLEIGGRKVEVQAKVIASVGNIVENKEVVRVNVTTYFTIRGRDVGLTGPTANEEIDVRVWAQGILDGTDTSSRRRRR